MAEQTETVEAVKNCVGCKKPISRARRYYRNGAYYCNKNCYKKKMAGTVVEVEQKDDKAEGQDKEKSKGDNKEQVENKPKDEAKKENSGENKEK